MIYRQRLGSLRLSSCSRYFGYCGLLPFPDVLEKFSVVSFMRILLFAILLAGAALVLHSFSGTQTTEVQGIIIDLRTITYTLVLLSALLVVEGAWQLVRRRGDRSLQNVIEAERSARIHAEREVQIVQDEMKSVAVRAENAEKRVRELVPQIEHAANERLQELEDVRRALKDTENKLAASAAKANHDPGSGPASVVALLGLLQEQGRFIDFLMEDITAYPDDRVAGAARFVHAGCSGVIKQYMDLMPIQAGDTGHQVTVQKEMTVSAVRFVGSAAVEFPATGKLLHRGWKATRLVLPKAKVDLDEKEGVVVTPAEVEMARQP